MKSPSWFCLSVFSVLIFTLNGKEQEKQLFTHGQNSHKVIPVSAPLQAKQSLQHSIYESNLPIRHYGRNRLKEIRCRYLKCDDNQESAPTFALVQMKESSKVKSNLNNFSATKYLDELRKEENHDDEGSGHSNDDEDDQSDGESVEEYPDEVEDPGNNVNSKWLVKWPRSNRIHRLNKEDLISQKHSWSTSSKAKYIELGTHKRIEPAFKSTYSDLPIASKEKRYEEMAIKMKTQGACKTPLEVVMKVRQFYPHPHKSFLPRCLKLHQCSNLSGCCKDGLKCLPAKTEYVQFYFRVTTIQENIGPQITFEALTFTNHTECACNEKKTEALGQDIQFSDEPASKVSLENRSKCPYPFSVRIISDGRSACDCYDKQEDCINYKNGIKKFRTIERSCLKSRACTKPVCNYGSYSIPKGRCLKQSEYRVTNNFLGQY